MKEKTVEKLSKYKLYVEVNPEIAIKGSMSNYNLNR